VSNVEVTIPNLVPGKRYRMVVEPLSGNAIGPSIEFKVPPAPRLLSTYRPTYQTITENYPQTGGDIIGYKDVISDPPAYTVSGTTSFASSIESFRGNGSNYIIIIRPGYSVPGAGQGFRVSGISFGSAPYYYDWLNFYAYSVSGRTVYASASLGNTTGYPSHWRTQGGRPFGDLGVKYSGTAYWTGAYSYVVDPDPFVVSKDPVYSTIVPAYTLNHVDVKIPTEIVSSLANSQTVVDVPVFMYKKSGQYYYLNDTLINSTKISGTLNPPSLGSKPTTTVMKQRNSNVNLDVSNRDYRFTVARYEYSSGSWSGRWIQKESLFDSNQIIENVILSQSAVSE
jgi:hypothetical protein